MTRVKIATHNVRVTLSDNEAENAIREVVSRGAELIGLQESNGRQAVLNRFDQFNNYTGGNAAANDTPIMWKTATFQLLDSGERFATGVQSFNDDGTAGGLGPRWVTWVKLKHRDTKRTLFLANVHMPPTIDAGGHRATGMDNDRLKTYDTIMDRLLEFVRDKQDQGAIFITGDFNIDYRKDSDVKNKTFPYVRFDNVNVHQNWRALGIPNNVHTTLDGGNRLVDYVSHKRVKAVDPISQDIFSTQSDHRAIIVTYTLSDAPVADNEEEPDPEPKPDKPPVSEPKPPVLLDQPATAAFPDQQPANPPLGTQAELFPSDEFNKLGLDMTKEQFRSELYRYFLVDIMTDEPAAELPFTGVTWGRKVNSAGEFVGTIQLSDEIPIEAVHWATQPGRMALYVLRGADVVFGGPIWTRDYALESRALTVQAATWESYLFRRYLWHTLTYPGTVDQYTLVRDLIYRMSTDFGGGDAGDEVVAAPFNADVKIEVDSRLSGRTQDAQIWVGAEMQTIGELLNQFADNLNGFEWNIDVNWDPSLGRFRRVLKFRDTPPGLVPLDQSYSGTRPGIDTNIFEYPGNIMTLGLTESADTAATRYFVMGGAPEGVDVPDTYKPRGAWNNNAFLSNNWPIIEVVESSKHPNVALTETLKKYARIYGGRAKPPVPTWNVTVNGGLDPVIGSYEVGDWCRLIIQDDPFMRHRLQDMPETDLSDPNKVGITKRIMGFSVNIPDVPQFPETVTLDLADEWTADAQ